MSITVLLPENLYSAPLRALLEPLLPPGSVIRRPEDGMEDLQNRRLLFAVALDPSGCNLAYYGMLRALRGSDTLLRGSVAGVIVTGVGEFYTKDVARDMVFAANQAGCAFLGRPLVEATGSLRNFRIQAQIGGVDEKTAFRLAVRELIARLDGGDEGVKGQLIERNLRLVVYIARRFENTGINIEDLISIGTIGLIKAINTFRADKNIKLATYASRCIENEILMYLRKNSAQRTEVSFDEPLNTDWDGKELLLSDVLGTDGDVVMGPIEADVDRKLLAEAVSRLSPREKDIISLRFGLGGRKEMTQKEVADRMGISQSYISRLEKRIISRLRREMQKLS